MARRVDPMPRLLLLAAATASQLLAAAGHGFLSHPISRNWNARLPPTGADTEWDPDGQTGGGPAATSALMIELTGSTGFPDPADTPASAARHGLCGDASADSPQRYLATDTVLKTLPAGEVVTLEVLITTHHRGHFEFALCDLGDAAAAPDGVVTQACLNQHRLLRADDPDTVSPIDPAYPTRYFLEPKCAAALNDDKYGAGTVDGATPDWVEELGFGTQRDSSYKIRAKYQLPAGLECAHCVLQWWYVTANSCNPPGYRSAPWPTTFAGCAGDGGGLGWWNPVLQDCAADGAWPEEFFNCADVAVVAGQGGVAAPPAPPPAAAEPTPNPTEPATSSAAGGGATTASTTAAADGAAAGGSCCTWDASQGCQSTSADWCHFEARCTGACSGTWIAAGAAAGAPSGTDAGTDADPDGAGSDAGASSSAGGSTVAVTPYTAEGTLSTGVVGSSFARLQEFAAALTTAPVAAEPRLLAVHSSGGAAGGVVSEGQGYGLLIAGATAAAMDPDDADRPAALELAYGTFLGWRRMCELSADGASCQADEGFQCNGGAAPCLPHWKFDDALSAPAATGAAPDGDADAMVGMMLAVLATEADAARPGWWAEVARWSYDTCKQFYLSNTADSATGNHRIVKLGSCWGGWDGQGQNPSYHAPGAYRLCRDFMQRVSDEVGAPAGEAAQYAAGWSKVVDTSYKMLGADQCPSTGLITNWATVSESTDGATLSAATGFSGSGTPGAEYGSEASRAVWRVALDYLLYPAEAATTAATVLSPVAAHVAAKESGGQFSDLDVDPSCLVDSVHASWEWNAFMFGPTFSALVCPAAELAESRQQQVLAAAGARIASSSITDYYSGSWVAISTITLNGDFSKVASLLHGSGEVAATPDTPVAANPAPAPAPAPTTAEPTAQPTEPATARPTARPTAQPTEAAADGGECVSRYGQCGGMNHAGGTACCDDGDECVYGNPWYSQCLPGSRQRRGFAIRGRSVV